MNSKKKAFLGRNKERKRKREKERERSSFYFVVGFHLFNRNDEVTTQTDERLIAKAANRGFIIPNIAIGIISKL